MGAYAIESGFDIGQPAQVCVQARSCRALAQDEEAPSLGSSVKLVVEGFA